MSDQNYHEFWQEALNQIHEEYKSAGQENEFLLWFNLDYVEDTLSTITVAVASEFMWHLMQSKGHVDQVTKKLCELTGQNITLKYIVRTKKADAGESNSAVSDTASVSSSSNEYSSKVTQKASAEEKKVLKHPQLRDDYTFDNFVPGENSAYAFTASLAAAKNPGRAYNPILIYGGVGLGKTHLMQSIGNYIYADKGPKTKICYLSAETFTNEFISSISDRTTDKFKSKYRNLDVLLLDDIHFLQGKDSTQEELFHTFNALYDRNCQMVFTCDRPVTELKEMTDRLRSRFSNGLVVDLQPPDFETRHAILLKKLETLGKHIPNDVIAYIAKNVVTNVRDLESALTKMIGYSELVNKNLTIDIAQQQLRDTFSQPLSGTITIDIIQKVIAD